MTHNDTVLLRRVQEIRVANNKCWMDIMRIALNEAPRKTRALLTEIIDNDAEVTRLMKQVAGGGWKKLNKD